MGLRGSKVLHTQLLDSVVGTHLRFFQVLVSLAVHFRSNTAIALLQAVVQQYRMCLHSVNAVAKIACQCA
jgi:hypothetical protein